MSTIRLFRAAKKYRERLFKLEEEALKSMRRAYTAAMSSVLNDLNKLEIQINKAIERGDTSFEINKELKQWYENKIDAIENKINQFNKSALEITKTTQLEAVKVGNQYAIDNLKVSLGKPPVPFDLNIISLDTAAMEAFVGFASNGSPLNDLFQKITTQYGSDIRDIISTGILNGENPRTIARRIKNETSMPLYRAETIARTESQRASRAATIENYKNNSTITKGYIRLATGDSRTCPACYALHKTTYELNKLMPTHPNCRCIIVPQTKTWNEITGATLPEDLIEEASDKIPTAEQLFNKLSEKDKRTVLGPERYNLYKNGTQLLDFVRIENNPEWGPTVLIKPMRELR